MRLFPASKSELIEIINKKGTVINLFLTPWISKSLPKPTAVSLVENYGIGAFKVVIWENNAEVDILVTGCEWPMTTK